MLPHASLLSRLVKEMAGQSCDTSGTSVRQRSVFSTGCLSLSTGGFNGKSSLIASERRSIRRQTDEGSDAWSSTRPIVASVILCLEDALGDEHVADAEASLLDELTFLREMIVIPEKSDLFETKRFS